MSEKDSSGLGPSVSGKLKVGHPYRTILVSFYLFSFDFCSFVDFRPVIFKEKEHSGFHLLLLWWRPFLLYCLNLRKLLCMINGLVYRLEEGRSFRYTKVPSCPRPPPPATPSSETRGFVYRSLRSGLSKAPRH